MIKPITFNILLILAVKYNWEVNLVNIITAFLYIGVRERIFIKQSTGFKENPNRVCLLLKALYSLK